MNPIPFRGRRHWLALAAATRFTTSTTSWRDRLQVAMSWATSLGSIGLAYDRQEDRVVLQFEEVAPDDEPEFDASRVRARITRAQAISFCENADRLAKAGRPPCVRRGRSTRRWSRGAMRRL